MFFLLLFFFNDTATTEIYTLSLHDALPIPPVPAPRHALSRWPPNRRIPRPPLAGGQPRGRHPRHRRLEDPGRYPSCRSDARPPRAPNRVPSSHSSHGGVRLRVSDREGTPGEREQCPEADRRARGCEG